MDESLVSKQDQVEAFQFVFNTYSSKNNPTSALQISAIFNWDGPRGGSSSSTQNSSSVKN
jgi:hypothetical protein